jgi:tryptophan-rich sensory protein
MQRLKQIGQALLFILVCQLAGASGALLTDAGGGSWYQMLDKPVFTPPSWVFAPAWITLYTLMGIAAYLIWRRRDVPGARFALGLFAAQLVLNAAWTPVFFGAHQVAAGFLVIVALWVVLAWTVRRFFPLSTVAGGLLVPYLLWVTYATVLNGAIWVLN